MNTFQSEGAHIFTYCPSDFVILHRKPDAVNTSECGAVHIPRIALLHTLL